MSCWAQCMTMASSWVNQVLAQDMQDGLHIRLGEPVGSFRTSDVGNYTQGRLGGLLNTLCNSNTLSSGFCGNLIDETSTLFAKGPESTLGTSSSSRGQPWNGYSQMSSLLSTVEWPQSQQVFLMVYAVLPCRAKSVQTVHV